jgi:phospho-N-acetylmuramoyl-pentapeptide-transferase
MLYPLLYPSRTNSRPSTCFVTLRFAREGPLVTALLISFLLGPYLILWLRRKQSNGQPICPDGPNGHLLRKKGTPPMGGFLILLALSISTLLGADLTNPYVWIVLLVTVGFGLIGFFDDYRKLTKNSHRGLSGRAKLALEAVLGAAACIAITYLSPPGLGTALALPFFKNVLLELGWFFVPFGVLVIVGASNSVNLTDGLDGLAIVPSMIAAGCFAVIAYLAGNLIFANYLQIHHVVGAGELTVFCGAMVGASLGFLWFNAPPAMVFMGDPGRCRSAPLSERSASSPLSTNSCSPLSAALFVLRAISVIVQVASFKMTGRRVFRMAPLHHHFEQKGWESRRS